MTVLRHMSRFTVLTVIMIATIPRNSGTIMRNVLDVFCSVLMASISLRELLLEHLLLGVASQTHFSPVLTVSFHELSTDARTEN